MRPHFQLTAIVAALIASAGIAMADGGWSGNGGHVHKDQDNVWFLEDEPVQYCIMADPAFPFSEEDLRDLVAESINEWRQFFVRYGLDQRAFGIASTLGGAFPDGSLKKVSLAFELVSLCDRPDEQLRFHFGGVPDDLSDYLNMNPNEFAAAVRGPYNHATYRTGGYIWFRSEIPHPYGAGAAPWARPLLKHMLLHELGHVFGMPHDSVYVMASTTGQKVAEYAARAGNTPVYDEFGRIETANWHYRYLVGDQVNFCEFDGGLFGIPVGSCWNGDMPREIRDLIGLDGEGYHQRIAQVVSADLIHLVFLGKNANEKRVEATIEIPLEGDIFKSVWDKGPGIYTQWLDVLGRPMYQRAGLDFESAMLPRRGTATLQSRTYGLLWAQGSGGLLYLPESQTWWNFTSPLF